MPPGQNPDASCDSSAAKEGALCTVDCQLGCGFQEIGTKYCTCVAGAYESCPCMRPAEFLGGATAPLCSTKGAANGYAESLKGMPCTTEWDLCIGEDPVDGSTPQGCACMIHAVTGDMQWFCGSTNKWFSLDTGAEQQCPLGADGVTTCSPLNPDPSCTSSNAKTGATCARDCQIGCGFQSMGTKLCTCAGGSYSQCPCPRPATFAAPEEAPLCTAYGSPDGLTTPLKGAPCDQEWAACIGTDPVTGTTPQGCACLRHELEGTLEWFCGSTNKWFKLEGT